MYRRQGGDDGGIGNLNPFVVGLLQVYAEAYRPVVDAHQFLVAEETARESIDKFFVSDRQELPLTYLLDSGNLRGGDVDMLVWSHVDVIVFVEPIQQSTANGDEQGKTDKFHPYVGADVLDFS